MAAMSCKSLRPRINLVSAESFISERVGQMWVCLQQVWIVAAVINIHDAYPLVLADSLHMYAEARRRATS